jgi:inhibitor of growth protein 3
MAINEDPASVLEQFIHDVANLPAEITHLYEEMQAKDTQIQECRTIIAARDNSLQKFIKLNGGLVQNPKEEPYSKIIQQNFDRAQVLQEEKIQLSEKAATLLDRHVKRLDIKLRDLQNEGSIPMDPNMPSLLRDSPGNIVPPPSAATTGANTPLNPLSGNTSGGAANIAHAAIAHIKNATTGGGARMNPSSLQNMQATALLNQQRLTNAQSAIQANARQEREMSAGSETKRRRMNASLGSLPQPPSSLGPPSSKGPGTPKASTPGSRAGSVGPNRPPKRPLTVKKALPQQPLRKQLTSKSSLKNPKRRPKNGSRASPSTTADDESVRSEVGSDDEEMGGMGGAEHEEDESDDTKYCFCQRVSFGDMVACDNENCHLQWFHWDCVGIKEEPVGDWLCPECRKLPANKIKRAR